MNAKVQTIYNKVINQASDLSMNLSKADYREFIEELEDHFNCLRMALDEEEENE